MARKKRPVKEKGALKSPSILEQREPYLLGVMVLLHLVPIWAFPYFTTCDGSVHTENAFLLDLFLKGRASEAMRAYYQLNLEPGANWLGSLFSVLLINIFPVQIVEKLLGSGYVIALTLSARYCLGAFQRRSYWVLLLLLPFFYNFLFNFGFFYFSYSIAVYLFVIGYWWRHREQMEWRRGLIMAGLGLLLFLAYAYITMQRRAINLANFEARSRYFPLKYVQNRDPYRLIGKLESTRPQLDISGYSSSGGSVDYVLVWGTPRDSQREHPAIQDVFRQLQAGYQLVRVSDGRGLMQVWIRKSLGR